MASPLVMRERAGVPVLSVMRFLCEQFELTQVELCSKRRQANLAHVRHIAFWLCRELTVASYPTIGRMFGGRDHTTVMHGVRKVDRSIASNGALGAQATFLKAVLEDRLQ
jgi:chromosomal replication initiator protein